MGTLDFGEIFGEYEPEVVAAHELLGRVAQQTRHCRRKILNRSIVSDHPDQIRGMADEGLQLRLGVGEAFLPAMDVDRQGRQAGDGAEQSQLGFMEWIRTGAVEVQGSQGSSPGSEDGCGGAGGQSVGTGMALPAFPVGVFPDIRRHDLGAGMDGFAGGGGAGPDLKAIQGAGINFGKPGGSSMTKPFPLRIQELDGAVALRAVSLYQLAQLPQGQLERSSFSKELHKPLQSNIDMAGGTHRAQENE